MISFVLLFKKFNAGSWATDLLPGMVILRGVPVLAGSSTVSFGFGLDHLLDGLILVTLYKIMLFITFLAWASFGFAFLIVLIFRLHSEFLGFLRVFNNIAWLSFGEREFLLGSITATFSTILFSLPRTRVECIPYILSMILSLSNMGDCRAGRCLMPARVSSGSLKALLVF